MSNFAERLVQQMIRCHQREEECKIETAQINEKLKTEEELKATLETAKAQLEKLERVRDALQKLNDESDAAYRQARERDEAERKALSGNFSKEIEAIQEEMKVAAERVYTAKSNHNTYKHQLEVYNSLGVGEGKTKVEEAIEARGEQIESLQKKSEANRARIPEMLKEIEEEKAKLEVVRNERNEVQEEVNVYVERFAQIRENLDKVKKLYDGAKGGKERQERIIRNLESDCQATLARAKKVKAEREKEVEKCEEIVAKVKLVQTQVEKLEKTLHMLLGEGTEEPADHPTKQEETDASAP